MANMTGSAAIPTDSFNLTTFISLPKEVHTRILHFITLRASLITVACVSRYFTPLAIAALWRNLDLTPGVDIGEDPQIEPSAKRPLRGHLRVTVIRERAFAVGRAKVAKIMVETKRMDWDMVRAVRVRGSVKGAELAMVVLRMVSQRLQAIQIVGYCQPSFQPTAGLIIPKSNPLIDNLMVQSDLSFPCLTHITIGPASYCDHDFIAFLCSRTPNLYDLDVNLDRCHRTTSFVRYPEIALSAAPISLRSLRAECANISDEGTDLVAYLIEISSQLQRLILRFFPHDHDAFLTNTKYVEPWQPLLIDALTEHNGLRELYWPIDSILYDGTIDGSPPRSLFGDVERLVTKSDWMNTLEWRHPLPKLQTLFLDCLRRPGVMPVPSPPLFSPEILLHFCDFADTLRHYPLLHVIHNIPDSNVNDFALFDQHGDWPALPSGYIGSMTHEGDEVICVRLLSHFEQVEDNEWVDLNEMSGEEEACADGVDQSELDALVSESELHDAQSTSEDPYITPGTTIGIRYSLSDNSMRERIYEQQSVPTWRVLCDYKGHLVPIEVVLAMRDGEGMSEEPWQRRGVEVDDRTWRILRGWYERTVQDEDTDEGSLTSETSDGSSSSDGWETATDESE